MSRRFTFQHVDEKLNVSSQRSGREGGTCGVSGGGAGGHGWISPSVRQGRRIQPHEGQTREELNDALTSCPTLTLVPFWSPGSWMETVQLRVI